MSIPSVLEGACVVPVVVIDAEERAVPLARTLVEAGLPVIEVTLRTPAALGAIARIAAEVPEMTVGAGSLRFPRQLAQAHAAGALFGVSPGSTEMLIDASRDAGLPLVPGAATASEVMRLLDEGFELLKFFPAGILGGAAAISALSAPLPEARFFPTGGVTADNVMDFLALPAVHCVGGTWVAPRTLVQAGDWARIGANANAASDLGEVVDGHG